MGQRREPAVLRAVGIAHPWDTQWDMFFALVGAIVAQVTVVGVHDRELDALLHGAGAVRARPRGWTKLRRWTIRRRSRA